MNIRKSIDYSDLYAGIDKVLAGNLPQVELYLELGRLVSDRPEKGAAVMAAEYITVSYPDRTGFSPRNLRRMRDFFRMYEGRPDILEQAMKVGWTQNIVIMEADLEMDTRRWYLLAVQKYGWSKAELVEKIAADAHLASSIEEEVQEGDCKEFPAKSFLRIRICHCRILIVYFLERLWYNWLWKLRLFWQKGITLGLNGRYHSIWGHRRISPSGNSPVRAGMAAEVACAEGICIV